tara:strand:+ start:4152 stop:4634 length:483 start_codon:yes stop_codon:yes gene_type:complete
MPNQDQSLKADLICFAKAVVDARLAAKKLLHEYDPAHVRAEDTALADSNEVTLNAKQAIAHTLHALEDLSLILNGNSPISIDERIEKSMSASEARVEKATEHLSVLSDEEKGRCFTRSFSDDVEKYVFLAKLLLSFDDEMRSTFIRSLLDLNGNSPPTCD